MKAMKKLPCVILFPVLLAFGSCGDGNDSSPAPDDAIVRGEPLLPNPFQQILDEVRDDIGRPPSHYDMMRQAADAAARSR